MSIVFLPRKQACDTVPFMRPKAVQDYFEKIARKGGNARAAKLSKEKRKKIATDAAKARWAKQRGKP